MTGNDVCADALVIGGGITGLTLGYQLRKAGQRVLVVEPGTPGGLISTKHVDGFTLENGPNVFVEKPGILSLLDSLGLSQSIRYPSVDRYTQLIWNGTRPRAAPKGPLRFLLSDLFSPIEKVRLLSNLFRKGVLRPRGIDESVASFMSPLLGERAVHEVLDPALKGIYGGTVQLLSARSLFPGLWEAASEGKSMLEYLKSKEKRGRIFVVEGGATRLIQKLLAELGSELLVKAAAERLVRTEDGVWQVSLSNGETRRVKRVFVSTSGGTSARIVAEQFPSLSLQLEEVPFAPLSVVHCAVPEAALKYKNSFGLVFPDGMEGRVLGIMFNSVLFPHVAPAGQALLTVCLGGHGSLLDECHKNAAATAALAIEQTLGIFDSKVLNTAYWERAIPQLLVGHHSLVADIQQTETENEGIHFCGTDRGGIGVPDRIEMALEACRGIQ